jgi:hypothetical protein
MKVYKIRDISTGAFLCATGRFKYNGGKTWSNLGHAKNAINCRYKALPPVEIVEYSVHESCRLRPTESFVGRSRIYLVDSQ